MTENRSLFRLGAFGIAFAYVYGAVLGALALAWEGLLKHRLPDWEWWQYALAPLGIGFTAAILELIGEYLANGFALKNPVTEKWWQYLAGVTLVLFMVILTLGPAFYKIRNG